MVDSFGGGPGGNLHLSLNPAVNGNSVNAAARSAK
jgi:hypothetical protein